MVSCAMLMIAPRPDLASSRKRKGTQVEPLKPNHQLSQHFHADRDRLVLVYTCVGALRVCLEVVGGDLVVGIQNSTNAQEWECVLMPIKAGSKWFIGA